MNLNLIFSIAKSLLLARWKQTLVAALGVTFSIGMFVTLLSFMAGLNDMLDGLILNRTPHIRIHNEIKQKVDQPINSVEGFRNHHNFIRSVKSGNTRQEIYNSAAIIKALRQDERVLGVAPKITSQVFFNNGNNDIAGVLNGIQIGEEARLFNFNDYITAGQSSDLERQANSIIMGKGLAQKLAANIGDVIVIITPKGERFPLKIAGFFQSGIKEFDEAQTYVSIATIQKVLGKGNNYITDIQVKLFDINAAPPLAREFARRFDADAEDIQTANAQFETGSFVRTLISYTVGITLLVVAGFGIYNILNMMIYEKMDSIAILKATGFSGFDVKFIFIVVALSIGLFGGVFGLILGLGLSVIIDNIPFNTAALPTITTYPINYSPVFYIIGFVFSTLTTYLAGMLPAQKASKVDPVIIIRGK